MISRTLVIAWLAAASPALIAVRSLLAGASQGDRPGAL
jgi:hypothetical protein